VIQLKYMVVPEELSEKAFVKDAVKIRITDSDSEYLSKILGESGKKLARSGVTFYFEELMAFSLINNGIAELA